MDAASTQGRGIMSRLFGRAPAPSLAPLYDAIVAQAREPGWYRDCGVPDTIDGRFDMVALILAIVLLRLERDDRAHDAVRLTERFIDDMDGQMRETGFGDLVVGKQVGGIMASLGGRLGSYRQGIGTAALARNLWRGSPPADALVERARARIADVRSGIDALPVEVLLGGRLS